MALHLYNTLTRTKEEFVPLDPERKRVLFYTCGPTVYGPFHIGNARTFTICDVARRWLEFSGYDVHFAQNITDVDDKIIDRAHAEGCSSDALARKYTELFYEHQRMLGFPPDAPGKIEHPKATDLIAEMIGTISTLIEKGRAYPSSDGSVWYEVSKFPEYGKLSGQNLEELRQGERVSESQQGMKRSPIDFCLWKAAKPGEPAWESPWGKGRPGWHIECSTMAMKCLGSETIDIHAGGMDLKFPHHENEIAQSEGATGKPFARYWMHCAFLNIDGEKMSKSLGNFTNIDQALEKFDPLTIRYFLISAHYRTELDLTEEGMHASEQAVRRIVEATNNARAALKRLGVEPITWSETARVALPGLIWMEYHRLFATAMDDDLNTAQALSHLFALVTELNIETKRVEQGEQSGEALNTLLALLVHFRAVLGLGTELEPKTDLGGLEGQLLQLLIDTRAAARKAKQFELGDSIRTRLAALGVTLEDKPTGTVWKKA